MSMFFCPPKNQQRWSMTWWLHLFSSHDMSVYQERTVNMFTAVSLLLREKYVYYWLHMRQCRGVSFQWRQALIISDEGDVAWPLSTHAMWCAWRHRILRTPSHSPEQRFLYCAASESTCVFLSLSDLPGSVVPSRFLCIDLPVFGSHFKLLRIDLASIRLLTWHSALDVMVCGSSRLCCQNSWLPGSHLITTMTFVACGPTIVFFVEGLSLPELSASSGLFPTGAVRFSMTSISLWVFSATVSIY